MGRYDYDLFVIGAGSGGVRASRMAARQGAKVAVAEHRDLGGTCVNVGCVPKKLFVYGSHFSEDFVDAAAYGWTAAPPAFDWPTLRDNKTREIRRLNGVYGNLLDGAGVETIRERARLHDAHTIEVGGAVVTAERILIATGSAPFVPKFPGHEHVITSDDAFYMPRFPERVIVVGGGYIAVEFAGIFQGLGAQTTLLYRGSLFLRRFDGGVREFVAEQLRHKGIGLKFDTTVESVVRRGEELEVTLTNGDVIEADALLYATGRRPNVDGLGVQRLGLALTAGGGVKVDDGYRTNVDSVYAIGDVIDRLQLTPVAIAEAMCLVERLFDGSVRRLDYDAVPTAVFCQPNIGTVGLTEEIARARYDGIRIFETRFRPMKHTMTGRDEQTLMKLVVRAADDRVVGAHMVGPEAGEIIQGVAVAINAGATKGQFDATVGIHPTAAEEFVTMREAAR